MAVRGVAKLMEFEYIELSPFTPLHLLLTEGWANGTNNGFSCCRPCSSIRPR
jgi:hypothetical protein